MRESLREFDELVDMQDTYRPGRGVPEPPDEDTITKCIQVMLDRQCIYPNHRGYGPYYRVLATSAYQGFFRKYFAAMGLEFYHETRSGMVALRIMPSAPRFDSRGSKLPKDTTAVLLALRLIYEEAYRDKQFSELGTVDTTTDEIYDHLQVVGNVEIGSGRITEIVSFLKRKGVIATGDKDTLEQVTPVTILPGIEVAVSATYVERVRMAAEAAQPVAETLAADQAASDPDGADALQAIPATTPANDEFDMHEDDIEGEVDPDCED